ncbi:N-acetylmuramoyl-L-alanine amidase [Paenibacillus sp. ACRRX]|uniref:N-acetylmuramoyl-L-alanine amidase n=1 Tax=Paenibacillus sp. ACRRX TaxID=2918206 RepID=UPI001EF441AF|nr:N-acetylmuramoyl-L-alanine amidase [Paenibacillus sp. ACRRX]MCG7410562.1 N-acetylmuramoyl-L-alanine amidase [Paenibacillus sp. ACRRX]
MEIKQRLLPDGKKNKPNKVMAPKYITLHETDNFGETATAEAHSRFVLNGSNGAEKSWHFTVDQNSIYQHLRTNEQGWHCGDGSGKGNASSIGIEICVNTGNDYERTLRNVAELVVSLMAAHKIPLDNVVAHKYWSGKNCPQRLLKRWPDIIKYIKQAQQPDRPSKPDNAVTVSVDGKPIKDGLIINGVTYVPVRAIGEAIGGKIVWNPEKVHVDMITK